MNRVRRALSCLILLAALPGWAVAGGHDHGPSAPPQAQPQPAMRPPPPAPPRRDVPQQDPSALPDSVRRVERRTGGEVLRAEPMQRDGREVYRMKVLTADGRIRVVQDDPNNPPPDHRRGSARDKDRNKDASSADGQDADEAPPENE